MWGAIRSFVFGCGIGAIVLGVGLLGYLYFHPEGSGLDVHLVNFKTGDTWSPWEMSGTLINEGDGADVWLWLNTTEQPVCVRKTYMASHERRDFKFNCTDSHKLPSHFEIHWATSPPSIIRSQATMM